DPWGGTCGSSSPWSATRRSPASFLHATSRSPRGVPKPGPRASPAVEAHSIPVRKSIPPSQGRAPPEARRAAGPADSVVGGAPGASRGLFPAASLRRGRVHLGVHPLLQKRHEGEHHHRGGDRGEGDLAEDLAVDV